jgi:hypothetical protein
VEFLPPEYFSCLVSEKTLDRLDVWAQLAGNPQTVLGLAVFSLDNLWGGTL